MCLILIPRVPNGALQGQAGAKIIRAGWYLAFPVYVSASMTLHRQHRIWKVLDSYFGCACRRMNRERSPLG